jgi:glycosyltransferase involved in cell wall biosynthesis
MIGSLKAFIRRIGHVILGPVVDRIAAKVSSGARNDLARYMHGASNAAVLTYGHAVVHPVGEAKRLAWVGPALEDETGIANFMKRLLEASPADVGVDYFCQVSDVAGFWLHQAQLRSQGVRLWPIEYLPLMARLGAFYAVVVSVGNSVHCVPPIKIMSLVRDASPDMPVWLHIHDGNLLTLQWYLCDADPKRFAEAISDVEGEPFYRRALDGPYAFKALEASGVFGVRSVANYMQYTGILVNSQTAAQSIKAQLTADKAPINEAASIHQVFHPVFANAYAWSPPQSKAIVVGTFGTASPYKALDRVVSACEILIKRGHDVRLKISGYGARQFARNQGWLRHSWIAADVAENVSALEKAMSACSVAVQLRTHNFGESSGVIAQLQAVGTPLIVGDIGALKEQSGHYIFKQNQSDGDLADLIMNAANKPVEGPKMPDDTYSAAAFWRLINTFIPKQ